MDQCTNCYYEIYCKIGYSKFYKICPCDIILPDQKHILTAIDSITEDLHAQYDE